MKTIAIYKYIKNFIRATACHKTNFINQTFYNLHNFEVHLICFILYRQKLCTIFLNKDMISIRHEHLIHHQTDTDMT